MKNIGPRSRQWLAEVGIYTIDDWKRAGSITSYKILEERYPRNVSLNLLWGLEAAIRDVDWRELPKRTRKNSRKSFVDWQTSTDGASLLRAALVRLGCTPGV